MKFVANSSKLLKELQKISGVLSTNNTLPILDSFLFELSENQLKVVASDLETTIINVLSVESNETGSIAIPAKILIDTLKAFSNQPLTFVINSESLGVEITSNNGNYKLAGQNANEFPKVPQMESPSTISIDPNIIIEAINKTIFACGNDDLRPVMSGIHCEINENDLTFVSTDAHKLVKHVRKGIENSSTSSFIIPKKPLNILKNILVEEAEITINYNDTNIHFSQEDLIVICRLIDGKYPNYNAVIPANNPNKLNIDRSLLLESLKRVAIYSNKTTHQVKLKIAGSELNISSEDIDFSNKAEERLTCEYSGSDIEIGFNSKFLIEILNNISSENIVFELSDPNRAGVIFSNENNEDIESTLMLVMPVMLNS